MPSSIITAKPEAGGPTRYELDETVEVLATALTLAQGYGHDLYGMSPCSWVDDAVQFRANVKNVVDEYWKDKP